jgi:hypothetical protein
MNKEQLRRKRIGETLRRRFASGEIVFKPPMQGKKHSVKTLEKMKKSAKERVAKGLAVPPLKLGKDHHWWKGGLALYESTHNWVVKNYGRPKLCERCGTTKVLRFEWSNNSGKYLKERIDWERLCVSCHRKKDGTNPKNPIITFPNNRQMYGKTR